MSQAQTTAAAVTELKASAHLMLLDPGVFCIFNSPGAARPDPNTGLPGVRLSAAPASSGFAGEVDLTGFSQDGWLEGAGGAALVRVTGGPAQVLVTVYQSADGNQEPPKLQVLRLTEAPAQPAPQAQPQPQPQPLAQPQPQPQAQQAQAASGPFEVAAHIYGRGDVAGRLGEWMGERGSKRWIEGFGLQPARDVPVSDLEYQAVLGRGWLSPWVEGGQFCGSRGMSLPILGLRVRLRGASAQRYAGVVAATFVDGTQIGPVGEGEACESPSLAALEAFIVMLQPKQAAAHPAPTPAAAPVAQVPRTPRAAKPAASPPAASPPAASPPAASPKTVPSRSKPAAKPRGRKR
jgi:hypothetical protein